MKCFTLFYIAFYLISTIFILLFFFLPIYQLILIFKRKLYTRQVIYFKKVSFILVFISLFFGILINLMVFLNIHSLFTFFKECPYNFSYNDIQTLFDINENKNIISTNTNKCSNKICVLFEKIYNETGTESYSYLCNFDSSYDFDSFGDQVTKKLFSITNKEENDKIQCNAFDYEEFENQEFLIQIDKNDIYIIKSYYDICSKGHIFYRCNRKEKPKNYKIKYDFVCPDIYDNVKVLLLGFLSLIFNFICSFIIFLYEFLVFNKLLIIYQNINMYERNIKTSLSGTTKNSSKMKPSNNAVENNSNNNNNSNINSQYLIIDSNIRRNENNKINENDINSNNEFNNENIISVRKRNNNDNNNNDFKENSITMERKIYFTNFNDNKSKNELLENSSHNSVDFKSIHLSGDIDKNKGKYLTESNNIINNNI